MTVKLRNPEMSTKARARSYSRQERPTARPLGRQDRTWSWSKQGKPDPLILADIVRRIVDAAKPAKIVLFGSAARGTMRQDSDIDLLVIQKRKFSYGHLLDKIERRLQGKGAPVDVILATAADTERYRDTPCLVICPALKEGRVVYDSEAPAAQ
jgi:predicted nucleotidyltransferase